MHVFLARHAQCFAAEERPESEYPPDDSALCAAGLSQATRLGRRLTRETPFDAVLTSPLARARETAEIVGAAVGVGVSVDERLREWGVPASVVGVARDAVPEGFRRWRLSVAEEPSSRYEDGESLDDVILRLGSLRASLVEAGWERVLLVSHYNVSRLFGARELVGADAPAALVSRVAAQLRFAKAAVSHLRLEPGHADFFVRTWNDRVHLDD